MSTIDLKELLVSGAHFGHKTSRWHPKMAPYIHSKKGDIHIIDLTITAEKLEEALKFVKATAGKDKQVLLVGTKRQAKDIIKEAAEKIGMPYVTERWLGGMLTNHQTMKGRIKRLKDLEEKMESGELAQRFNKLEVQRFQEEITELNRIFGGIKNLSAAPGAVFVTDIQTDELAVKEARRLGIPVIGIVDTNVDPTLIDYPIPANDDAIKTLQLITNHIVTAIEEGKGSVKKVAKEEKE